MSEDSYYEKDALVRVHSSDSYDDLKSSRIASESSSLLIEETDEFSHLPGHEASVLRAQVQVVEPKTSFFTMYRYATSRDVAFLIVATVASILEGTIRPTISVIFGTLTGVFATYARRFNMDEEYFYNSTSGFYSSSNGSFFGEDQYNKIMYGYPNEMNNMTSSDYQYISPDEFQRTVNSYILYVCLLTTSLIVMILTFSFYSFRLFVYLGVADIILSYFSIFVFIDRGQILSGRIREHYLKATMKQNIGYFDKLGSGEVTTRISSDTTLIQEGMSEKVSYMIANLSTFVTVYVLAFTRFYILTFMMLSIAFAVTVSLIVSSGMMKKYFKKAGEGYAVGGTLAEETISSIRNVQAFGIQDRLVAQYDKYLEVSERYGIKAGFALVRTILRNVSNYYLL